MESRYEPVHIDIRRLLLNFAGLKPPTSFVSSFWKSLLYEFYAYLIIFSHLPFFTFQIIGVFAYHDDFHFACVMIFQMTVCTDAFIILAYFTFHREYLWQMFSSIDHKFDHFDQLIGTSAKRNKILNKSSRKARKYTIILICSFSAVVAGWCVIPFFVKIFSHEQIAETNSTTPAEQFKYFVMAMWLPENALQSPMYEIIYLGQFLYILSMLVDFTVGNVLFSSVYYDISVQFKILSSAIEDIDSLFNAPLTKSEIKLKSLPLRELKTSNPLKKYDNYESGDYMAMKRETSDNLEDLPVISVSDEHREIDYMVNCINFHQELLEFCKEIDGALSPLLLIYIFLYEIMICVPLLQLVLGKADDKFRYMTSAVDTTILPLSICLCGQILSNESMGVQKAAYGCQWYHRSPKLKKLLQMIIARTQEPVRMTAGKFFVVSLETFADIGNKVYAYFTVLKNFR